MAFFNHLCFNFELIFVPVCSSPGKLGRLTLYNWPKLVLKEHVVRTIVSRKFFDNQVIYWEKVFQNMPKHGMMDKLGERLMFTFLDVLVKAFTTRAKGY